MRVFVSVWTWTYPLAVEATPLIQVVEVVLIPLRAEEIHVCNLEVAPVMAQAPCIAVRIAMGHPAEKTAERKRHPGRLHHGAPQTTRGHTIRLFPVRRGAEEAGARLADLPQRNRVAVHLLVLGHLDERVVRDGAGEVHIWLEPPVPFVLLEGVELVELSGARDVIG